ncbi:SAM-dependent methyltransferase [hydrothermal vent metagenome]|uniref:SAM-dependent methyltransferase n=1 Tax=hydrothermal vent metagenome TaxID=652676 RepID=A0A3B0QZ94_9ZZZZ
MNKEVLNTAIQNFINNNLNSDISSLLLKGTAFDTVDTKEIIEQIEAKKKSENKLPTWFNTPNIYYPNKLNIEQTSSEITAQYKSQLVSGSSLIDLTGGLGVDVYYFSKTIKSVTHCEVNSRLSNIASYNFEQLTAFNINTTNEDGLEYLRNTRKVYDWIYIDPSRRHDIKGKVFYLKDCLPNVTEHIDSLFKYSNNILIKASPMLDISVGLSELRFVKEIHIVAINNDVKELLFILENGYQETIGVKTINIRKNTDETFAFNLNEEAHAEATFGDLQSYLYEPNSAILKSGAFKTVSHKLKVNKLHKHSHLYTSTELIDFPGRRFKILETIPYNKKLVEKVLKNKKANISTRNFTETASQLKKKFKIKDGGNLYVFFTTNVNNEKIVVLCNKA